jgi:N-acetylneuraminic acid mutarotase
MAHKKYLSRWLQNRKSPRAGRAQSRKLVVELLEDRTVLSPLKAGPVGLHATEGLVFNGAVTTFTDANTADTQANFTATISWGDNTISAGTVTGSAGNFTVSGQHTYLEEGNYPLSAVITEDNGVSITAGGPPVWTQLAATLPPSIGLYGVAALGRSNLAATGGTDGKIYTMGGYVGTVLGTASMTDEVDAYDPSTQAWTQLPSMPSGPRRDLAATTGTDGTIYAMGGLNANYAATNEMDAYNPGTQTWSRLPDLPNFYNFTYPRQFDLTAATGTDGTIYAIGGFYTDEVDAYNPATRTWTQVAFLPSERNNAAATTGTDGTIYFIGGYDDGKGATSNEVDAYNPATNKWTVLPSLPTARSYLAAATGKDGTIYAFGGYLPTGYTSNEVDAYNPVTKTWTVLAQCLPNSRASLVGAVGTDGTIYAMGGWGDRFITNEVDTYTPPGIGASTSTVTDAAVNAAGIDLVAPGVTLIGQTVASFTDPGGAEPISHYSATISWGDQSNPVAADGITYDSNTGQFTVIGSHTYASTGNYSISVSVQHESAPATLATTTAQIGNLKPAAFITGPTTGETGQTLSFTVSASDPNTSLNEAGFAYSIDWGDGSNLEKVQATAGNGAGVTISHAFGAGSYIIQVMATDQAGNSATATQSVTTTSANTTTSLSTSANPSPWGQYVSFTAAVSVLTPGGGTPTGIVDFYDSDNLLGPGTLQVVNGIDQATFSTDALTVGDHTITASYSGDVGYFGSTSGSVTETISQVSTTTGLAISTPSPLAGTDSEDLTATVSNNVQGILTGSVDFVDTSNNQDLGISPVVNGTATLHTGAFSAGTHIIAASYSGDPHFGSSSGTASFTALAPASLSGTVFEDFNNDGQVDFGEKGISGVSISLTGTDDLGHSVNLSQVTDGDGAYVFLNLRPGAYNVTKTSQPSGYTQGIDSVGTAGGQLSAVDQFFVNLAQGVNGLNYNYGEQPAATGAIQQGQTAGIGFWNNKKGQALILALNGGTGHQLGDWLATTLVNMYGATSANDLAGKSNAYIANLFQQDFVQKGQKLDAQVLATALSVYATNATLDSTQVAAQYGFKVSGDGVGTATVNVGSNGDAFGVANNTTLTVFDLLLAADAQAVNGVLYNGNSTPRNEANNIFSLVNQAGAIN